MSEEAHVAKMMTPQEMFEAWQKMFNPANYTPGASSMQMFPDLKDIETSFNTQPKMPNLGKKPGKKLK